MTEFEFLQSWETKEIHPRADEFCLVLSGEVELVLFDVKGDTHSTVKMAQGYAHFIPKNTWHTVKLSAPARMLFITMGRATEVLPVDLNA